MLKGVAIYTDGGRSGDPWNEHCDHLCSAAIESVLYDRSFA
jgi:hypothetical protein